MEKNKIALKNEFLEKKNSVLVSETSLEKKNKLYNPQDIIELIEHNKNADSHISAVTTAKLELIAKQINYLQLEAHNIIKEAEENIFLTRAKCNFKRLPNHIYHLYKKENDEYYFSMLSPKEWNQKNPHNFIGSYKLEKDMSWTNIEKINNSNEINYLE